MSATLSPASAVTVNGRTYQPPRRPSVVICLDGCDPEYLARGIPAGVFPTLGRFAAEGFAGEADAAVPTFTNPNNVSIVTGAPPAVHGISGNYYLDRETGKEVMITDGSLMRAGTVLAALNNAGVPTVVVTAKDKLRKMLGRGMQGGICFSSEKASAATVEENGIADLEELVGRPTPNMYSGDLSLFVLDAGIKLLEQGRGELFYLSLSDYIQHGHAPGEPESDEFHRAVDERVGRLIELGAVVGLVADHGMRDKAKADGSANVIYLEDELNARFGPGAARVICPITDPYVKHHGALGSFVRVYRRAAGASIPELMAFCAQMPGVEAVLSAAEAAERYHLPIDREGDFIVLSDAATVVGATTSEHNLAGLDGHRLRSHGGLGERRVPFLVSEPLTPEYRRRAAAGGLHNYDIFDFVLNGTE